LVALHQAQELNIEPFWSVLVKPMSIEDKIVKFGTDLFATFIELTSEKEDQEPDEVLNIAESFDIIETLLIRATFYILNNKPSPYKLIKQQIKRLSKTFQENRKILIATGYPRYTPTIPFYGVQIPKFSQLHLFPTKEPLWKESLKNEIGQRTYIYSWDDVRILIRLPNNEKNDSRDTKTYSDTDHSDIFLKHEIKRLEKDREKYLDVYLASLEICLANIEDDSLFSKIIHELSRKLTYEEIFFFLRIEKKYHNNPFFKEHWIESHCMCGIGDIMRIVINAELERELSIQSRIVEAIIFLWEKKENNTAIPCIEKISREDLKRYEAAINTFLSLVNEVYQYEKQFKERLMKDIDKQFRLILEPKKKKAFQMIPEETLYDMVKVMKKFSEYVDFEKEYGKERSFDIIPKRPKGGRDPKITDKQIFYDLIDLREQDPDLSTTAIMGQIAESHEPKLSGESAIRHFIRDHKMYLPKELKELKNHEIIRRITKKQVDEFWANYENRD